MEHDSQIFIRISNDEPIEFLLLEQPLDMIKADIVTKQQICETIESGFQHPDETFTNVVQL